MFRLSLDSAIANQTGTVLLKHQSKMCIHMVVGAHGFSSSFVHVHASIALSNWSFSQCNSKMIATAFGVLAVQRYTPSFNSAKTTTTTNKCNFKCILTMWSAYLLHVRDSAMTQPSTLVVTEVSLCHFFECFSECALMFSECVCWRGERYLFFVSHFL